MWCDIHHPCENAETSRLVNSELRPLCNDTVSTGITTGSPSPTDRGMSSSYGIYLPKDPVYEMDTVFRLLK